MNVLSRMYIKARMFLFLFFTMFLRCSYFFGNLSLNVLINMVLTKKKSVYSLSREFQQYLKIVFQWARLEKRRGKPNQQHVTWIYPWVLLLALFWPTADHNWYRLRLTSTFDNLSGFRTLRWFVRSIDC